MRAEDEIEYVEYVTARLPVLHRTAYLLCGDAHRADDIVQITLTKLYRHWHRVSTGDNTDAYVRQMLVRTYLDDRRRGLGVPGGGWRLVERDGAARPVPLPAGSNPEYGPQPVLIDDAGSILGAVRAEPPGENRPTVWRCS